RRIDGILPSLTEEQEARQQAIKAEIEEIEEAAADEHDYSEEQLERIDALEEELGANQDRQAVYEPEQKARALAYVVIGEDGQPMVE
ncbi:hypothetical protein ACI3PF_20875, partial [Lactococcus lactis]